MVLAQSQAPPTPPPDSEAAPAAPPPAVSIPGAEPATTVLPTATVLLDGRSFQLPVTFTEQGPLFALRPLVDWLGGVLEPGAYGDGYKLKLRETELLFGPQSPAVTLGDEILPPLSQPPAMTLGGLAVPLDFLRLSFGDLLGHRFSWDPTLWQLTIERYQAQALRVTPTLVHLGGSSTLSLRFSAPPRFRIVEQPDGLDLILGDQLAVTGPTAHQEDPLVEDLSFGPDRIHIRLAPDATVVRRPRPGQASAQLVFEFERGRPRAAAADLPPAEEGSSPIASRPRRRPGIHRIVLDPGHGGTDTGAIATNGITEKDLTLQLARQLREQLEARLGGVQVLLTRNDDRNLSLEARTSFANQEKADLFISLHLNSSFGSRAQGTETYILSLQASDPRAAAAAELENRSGAVEPPATAGASVDPLYDLQLILWDMAQSYQLNESQRFAALIQGELNSTLGLRDRGVKQAPFRVLMGAAMPAVLVELGFLSHPEEESQLQDPAYQTRLAAALARAVGAYREQQSAETSP